MQYFESNNEMIFQCQVLAGYQIEDAKNIGAWWCMAYAGTVKQFVCKRHVAIDTGFKQTKRAIFLHVISMG